MLDLRKLWFLGPVVLLFGIAVAVLLRPIRGESVQLELSPLELDFGRVAIGAAEEGALVATNAGVRPLYLEAVPSEGAFHSIPASLQLAPGESRPISVAFRPRERGAVVETLVLASEGRKFPIALRGTGFRPPTLGVTPLSLSFGDVAVGASSRGLVTIRNSGDEGLELSVHGARVFTPETQAAVVAPGEALALQVSFAPDRVGRLEEELWIESNDPARAGVRLHLRGSGTAAAPRPVLETSTDTLDFGTVSACESSQRWVDVSNRGSDQLTIASVTASAPFSAPDRGFRLEPGRSFRLPVAFAPLEAGPILSPLLIHSNDPHAGVTAVSLTGKGEDGDCERKGAGEPADASGGGGWLGFRSWPAGGPAPDGSPEAAGDPEPAKAPMDAAGEAPVEDAADPVATGPPAIREGSYIDVGTYRADINAEHVAAARFDAASGRLALEGVQLPIVELPFDQYFDFEPSDAAGRVGQLGDIDLLLPVAIVDEEGTSIRLEVALTTGTAASVSGDGTLVTLAGEPLGTQGDATLVGLATLPGGGLGGALMEIVLNVHVEP